MERGDRYHQPEPDSDIPTLADLHRQLEQVNCWLESDAAVENSIDGFYLRDRLLEERDEVEQLIVDESNSRQRPTPIS